MTDIADLIERDPTTHALAARLCIEELRRENAALKANIAQLTQAMNAAMASFMKMPQCDF